MKNRPGAELYQKLLDDCGVPLERVYIEKEEIQEYKKQGYTLYNDADINKPFYEVVNLDDETMDRLFRMKFYRNIHVIKNCALFFVILTIIGLVISLFLGSILSGL